MSEESYGAFYKRKNEEMLDRRMAAQADRIAELEAELARRTTERDYHLRMADLLADKVSANKEQPKRPVAFRVRRKRTSDDFELFADEEGAQAAASDRGVDYEGLYLVGDRRAIAKPELWDDAGLRIAELEAELAETIKSSDAVCDSYAKENQRLSDERDALQSSLTTVTAQRDAAVEALRPPTDDEIQIAMNVFDGADAKWAGKFRAAINNLLAVRENAIRARSVIASIAEKDAQG